MLIEAGAPHKGERMAADGREEEGMLLYDYVNMKLKSNKEPAEALVKAAALLEAAKD